MDRLNRRSMTALVSLAMLILLTIPSSMNSSAASPQPIGSEWVYDYTDEIPGIVFSGTWTYSCERITSTSLGGQEREVVEYDSVLAASASIAPLASGNVEGTITDIGKEYYDPETGDLVGYVSTRTLDLNATILGGGSLDYDLAEYNETSYLPPGGSGTEPTTIYPGDTWTKIYLKHSKTQGRNGEEYFSNESTYNVTVSYKFLEYEKVSVPAGEFECAKIKVVSSTGVVEHVWYSSDIMNYVVISDLVGQSEIVTCELRSYTLSHEQAEPTGMGSNMFLAIFYTLIASTVLATVYAEMTFRRGKPPAVRPAEPQRLDKEGIDPPW